jgi:hypothetical protein
MTDFDFVPNDKSCLVELAAPNRPFAVNVHIIGSSAILVIK